MEIQIKNIKNINRENQNWVLERLLLDNDDDNYPCIAFFDLVRMKYVTLEIFRFYIPCLKDSDGLGIMFYALAYFAEVIEVDKSVGRLVRKARKKLAKLGLEEIQKLRDIPAVPTASRITYCAFVLKHDRHKDTYTIRPRKEHVRPFTIRFVDGKVSLVPPPS